MYTKDDTQLHDILTHSPCLIANLSDGLPLVAAGATLVAVALERSRSFERGRGGLS